LNPNLHVIDKTMERFTRIPSYIEKFIAQKKITYKDALVYGKLLSYVNSNTGECFPSQSTLAEAFGVDKKSIQRSIKRLEKVNLLDHHNEGVAPSSHYFILDPIEAVDKLNGKAIDAHSNHPFLPRSKCPQVEDTVTPDRGHNVARYNLLIKSNDSSTTSTNPQMMKIEESLQNLSRKIESVYSEGGFTPFTPSVTELISNQINLINLLLEATPPSPSSFDAKALDADGRDQMEESIIETSTEGLYSDCEGQGYADAWDDQDTPSLCGALEFKERVEEAVVFSKEMQTKGLKKKDKEKVGKKVGLTEKRATQVYQVFEIYANECIEQGFEVAHEPTRKQAAKISALIKNIPNVQLVGQVAQFAVRNWVAMSHRALPADMAARCGNAPVLEILFTQALFENWMRLEKNPTEDKPKRKVAQKASDNPDAKFQKGFEPEVFSTKGFDTKDHEYQEPSKNKERISFDYE
jgi:predicted transcriptional regulator